MPRRENRATPKVVSGMLYGEQSFPLESPDWWAWLNAGQSFYVEMPTGGYTARREWRRGVAFWYALKRSSGKLHKAYLGHTHELTAARLLVIAGQLEAKIAKQQAFVTDPSHGLA